MNKPILFIDTDMGVDDIIAICMLVASKQFDIKGISVINGVATQKCGVKNLGRILTFIGLSCPIFSGDNQKTQNSNVQFPLYDRRRANALALLSNISLPSKGANLVFPLSEMIAMIQETKSPVSILAIGPLTDISSVIASPALDRIRTLTIMGGAVEVPGNVSPKNIAEYNFRLDPKAANMVLNTSTPVQLVPIDATRSVPAIPSLSPLFYQTLKQSKPYTPEGVVIKNIILNNSGDFQSFYDPLAAAILIDPTIVNQWVRYDLSVSLRRSTLGKVSIRQKGNGVVRVPAGVNEKGFYRLMLQLVQ